MKFNLFNENDTLTLAKKLASVQPNCPFIVNIQGALGLGKSFLARAWLSELGVSPPIPSPTFTLCEPYETVKGPMAHLDLYRLNYSCELDFIGIAEYSQTHGLLVEWPDRGGNFLSMPDLAIDLKMFREYRVAGLSASTATGADWIDRFAGKISND